jgi:hypothetical protein
MIDDTPLVYLLHFDAPLGRFKHYVGSTRAYLLPHRMRQHQSGNGARITSRLVQEGIGFTLARIWRGADRVAERKIKRAGHYTALCPICDMRLYNEMQKGARFTADPFKPLGLLSIEPSDLEKKRGAPPLEQKRAAEAGRSRSLQGG